MGQLAHSFNNTTGLGAVTLCPNVNINQLVSPPNIQSVSQAATLPPKEQKLPFGLPPYLSDLAVSDISSWATTEVIKSLRILKLVPGTLKLTGAYFAFNFEDRTEQFKSDVTQMIQNLAATKTLNEINSIPMQVPTQFVVNIGEISENLGNTLMQNELARAAEFGGTVVRQVTEMLPENGANILPTTSSSKMLGLLYDTLNKINNYVEQGTLHFKNSTSIMENIVAGGRVDIPQLWEDSNFKQSYTFQIKLIARRSLSSIWENVVVPLAYLLVYSSPKLMNSNVAYFQPYYVQASVKNTLFIPIGMITGLQIDRGSDGALYTSYGDLLGVNVNITVDSVFNVLINASKDFSATGNITAQSYLKVLLGEALDTSSRVTAVPQQESSAGDSGIGFISSGNGSSGGSTGVGLMKQSDRNIFVNGYPNYKYNNLINYYAQKYNLPPKLVYAVICQESSGNPTSTNSDYDGTTDYGLMGINSSHLNQNGLTINNIKDPATNINAGCRILAAALTHCGTLAGALTYYNAGNRGGCKSSNYSYSVSTTYNQLQSKYGSD